MNWNEPNLIVSIVAVIIAGISLLWNIINAIIRNQPSLKVQFSVLQQMTSNITGGLDNPIPVFSIKITNVGFIVRDVEAPTIKLIRFELNGNDEFNVISVKNPINFPVEILPGKRFIYDISVYSFMEKFKNIPINAKLKVIVTDTYGKKYKANKIKISEVKKQISVSQKFENQ